MIDEPLIKKVLCSALSRGGDFAEIYAENVTRNGFTLEDGKIERALTGIEKGAAVRLIKDGRTSFSYTERLDEESLLKAAQTVSSGLSQPAGAVGSLSQRKSLLEFPMEIEPGTVPREQISEIVKKADSAARNVGHEIVQVIVNYADKSQKFMVANSEGILVSDDRNYIRFAVQAVAKRGSQIETGFEGPAAQMGFEFFNSSDPENVAAIASKRAIKMLDARESPAGKMPVVLRGGHGGVLFHEACGHGLEADSIAKNSSVFCKKIGEMVASPLVTLLDDATLPSAWGSYSFDDEGNFSQKTYLIEEGVLRSYLNDYLKGKTIGMASTGNGRRESFRHIPIPRMSNTYLAPGNLSPEEIISQTDHGFYAAALSGGQVEPATGDFVFGVAEGYLIEKGKLGGPVKGATLVGNGLEILKNVDLVADDLSFKPGVCGKDGQSVPVGTGQPTVRIEGMIIGGTRL